MKLAALVDGVLGSAAHRADVETAIKRVLESGAELDLQKAFFVGLTQLAAAAQSGLVRFDGKKVKPCKKRSRNGSK